ncbi:MAG: beta-ketoacyl-ACP synthase II [Phycisphaeraceae bacterium]|nr:beta-ketoacyl-ACP synthase II [Phycisphaeraceae bacterium]
MPRRRVVVTGLGLVTCLGHRVDDVFDRFVHGQSGIKPITRFDASGHYSRIGGEITTWEGGPHLNSRDTKRLDRFAQFAMHSAIEAVNQSGLDFSKENAWRCGAIIGTGIGGMEEFELGYRRFLEKGPDRVSPFMVPKLMCNAASGNVSIHFGIRGPNTAITSACASAAHAIGEAFDCVRNDVADVMVTGGSEAALTPLGLACFTALKALSRRNDDPQAASRPFDLNRDGFVLGEGAGILILEELEHARARGANILAEVLGYGQSADGSHITAPDEQGKGAAFAMGAALKDAGLEPEKIDYINAHGTSTPLGDVAEVTAIKRLFGEHAAKVPVSSTKSMIGHSLGASGGIEAVACVKTINGGVIHPTINQTTPDERCDLDFVPNTAREAKVRHVLSNSFGFGGHNVSLAFGAFE